jgi:hypothetical protein
VVQVKEARDFRRQLPVLERVRAGAALAPRVEPRPRDAVAPTEGRHFEGFEAVVLRDGVLDEGEAVAFRSALRALQNRMAFFKRSCSSLSSVYLRSSAWS